jgi:chemotaxis protein methyltransferase CheR
MPILLKIQGKFCTLPVGELNKELLNAADQRTRTMNEAAAFQFIISLIYERAGIRLHDGKRELIKARLGKRMRHFGFAELSGYCDFLRTEADEEEITNVVDCLTTNFTHFLREEEHFKFLVDQALPAFCGHSPCKFRIWCAACASGEEAYSLAIYLFEHFPPGGGWDWSILATDISTRALAKAAQGIYPSDKLEALPLAWRHNYFQIGQNKWEGYCRVKPMLSQRIAFKQLNLLKPYDFSDEFAVIFCRNVMIYFDRPTQEYLMQRLVQHLAPKGYIIVGHAESLTGLNVALTRLSPSIYQKT